MGLLTPLTDRYAAAGLTDVTVRTKAGRQLCSFIRVNRRGVPGMS